jgi:uncharacterized RDD family membrane protein YckC
MERDRARREPVDTAAAIETPEHICFHHQLAGPARRALAYLLDAMLRGALLLTLAVLALGGGAVGVDDLGGASFGLWLLALFVVEWGYYVFWDAIWSGRSPGKRALGLRVVTASGHPLNLVDSVLRNLLRAADFLPSAYALGVVVMARESRFRRLGDLVAGTMVVVEGSHRVEGPLQIYPPPAPIELAGLPARLPLSGDELDAIDLFLRRASRLSPGRAAELAELVAPVFARRLAVRYESATRFLALLYHRAHERRG